MKLNLISRRASVYEYSYELIRAVKSGEVAVNVGNGRVQNLLI